MTENSREVDHAVTALATEIMKLSGLDGDQRTALSLVIENTLARLAAALVAQSQNFPFNQFPADRVGQLRT